MRTMHIMQKIHRMTEFEYLFSSILAHNNLEQYNTPENCEKFDILCRLLIETNKKYNLTAIYEPSEIILRHFADSLTVVHLIAQTAEVIDVGCGGGFPALPLAIVRPDLTITALDATAKKLEFVDVAAKELGLCNIKTLCCRAEEAVSLRESFDVAVSRAVARMNILAEICMPFVKVGGTFVAMKGFAGKEELDEAAKAVKTLGGTVGATVAFNLLDAGSRFIITVNKTSQTPAQYPRAWAKIKKRPL